MRALRAKSVQVGEIKLGGEQSYQAWFSDPDGNGVELHRYTPKSWQAPWLWQGLGARPETAAGS